MVPEVRYAKSGDIRIAYQVLGDGPLDLVLAPGFFSNLEHYWEEPALDEFLHRLASFSRLILFDKRGTGLSDRTGHAPSLEQRMDDVRAVMDGAGSERAAVFGVSEGGAMSMLFAATYPERTRALVLYGAYAHFLTHVLASERLEAFLASLDATWGKGVSLRVFAPSMVNDVSFSRWWARGERLGASPSTVVSLMRMNSEVDLRHILSSIRVPTLVLHRTGDRMVAAAAGRRLAEDIKGAVHKEFPGDDHLPWVGDSQSITSAIEEFLTGSRRAAATSDRVLTTIMFTDIVESTRRASELGDHRWRLLLDRHDEAVRRQLSRFRGKEVKTLGDGFLATFDGPARAVQCALAIREAVQLLGIEVRSGLHTGEVELVEGDVRGIAVHIASRVAELAAGGEVLVSRTVRDLVAGSGLPFSEHGARHLQGLEGEFQLYSVR